MNELSFRLRPASELVPRRQSPLPDPAAEFSARLNEAYGDLFLVGRLGHGSSANLRRSSDEDAFQYVVQILAQSLSGRVINPVVVNREDLFAHDLTQFRKDFWSKAAAIEWQEQSRRNKEQTAHLQKLLPLSAVSLQPVHCRCIGLGGSKALEDEAGSVFQVPMARDPAPRDLDKLREAFAIRLQRVIATLANRLRYSGVEASISDPGEPLFGGRPERNIGGGCTSSPTRLQGSSPCFEKSLFRIFPTA